MKPRRALAVLGALGVLWSGLALAAPPQTVYRCGPEGRTYSQTPCADGKPVTVDDPRSASQQQAARDVASRDAARAQKLADERREREAAARHQAAAGIKSAPAADAASAPARKAKKSKKATADDDPNMSPAMRVPAQATR